MTTRTLFGTDGIRGRAGIEPITPTTMARVAYAAGQYFSGSARPTVLIGRDTRASSLMIERALADGFAAAGFKILSAGVLPTPAIAYLTKQYGATCGVMITASHNPWQDNGIKFFDAAGHKLSNEAESAIESLMDHLNLLPALPSIETLPDAAAQYSASLIENVPSLVGLRIALDCAHGAAYQIAPDILHQLGATVISIAAAPDGQNINRDCGATHLAMLKQAVLESKADLGLALDGDADRLLMVDEQGRTIDGDQIMSLLAVKAFESGTLAHNSVVMTVMSNLGMEKYLDNRGIAMLRAAVGDRYVAEAMKNGGYTLGGEQSGHIIMAERSSTGDGLAAALQILPLILQAKEAGQPASSVLVAFTPYPQKLKNITVSDVGILEKPGVKAYLATQAEQIAGRGRILVRKSGTEPLIRVMVEADDAALVESLCDEICSELLAQDAQRLSA